MFGLIFFKDILSFQSLQIISKSTTIGTNIAFVFFSDSAWVADHCSPGIRINESSGGRYRNVFRRYQL